MLKSRLIEGNDLELPKYFLNKEVLTDQWNNIPIPLTQSTDQFKKAFIRTSNILTEFLMEN